MKQQRMYRVGVCASAIKRSHRFRRSAALPPHDISLDDLTIRLKQDEQDREVQQRTLRVSFWGVVVALVGAAIAAAVAVYELRILNDGLRIQNDLLNQQVVAIKQQADELQIQGHLLAAGAFRDLEQQNIEIQKLLFAEPQLYPFFYEGEDPRRMKSDTDRARSCRRRPWRRPWSHPCRP